jgi:hypothetical protein
VSGDLDRETLAHNRRAIPDQAPSL